MVPTQISIAKEVDFSQFPRVSGARMRKGRAMADLEKTLNEAIPALMEYLPRGKAPNPDATPVNPDEVTVEKS